MRRVPISRSLLACAAGVAMALVDMPAHAQKQAWPNPDPDPSVTPVAGPSWLTQLGVRLDHTRLGGAARQYGPAADQKSTPPRESAAVPRTVSITGADVYRLNCQACHLAEGTGAPPEIRPVLGVAQSVSLALVRERFRELPRDVVVAQTTRARMQLLDRIHQGGSRMPPRGHLDEGDIQALFAYLTELAGAPDAEHAKPRVVSWARLGEHVVKGTCHICHDAVGPRPTPAALEAGAIPSLASLLETTAVNQFVHKARAGGPVLMGDPAILHRGRMPVFSYLRDHEVASAYVYLATYPPQASAARR